MGQSEDARECQRCSFRWYAVPVRVPSKPRWFDEAGPSLWTDSQARMARLQGNYTRQVAEHERWAKCPNCGSIKVKTVKGKGFTPTGALSPVVPLAPAPDAPAYPSPPPQPRTQEVAAPSTPDQVPEPAADGVHPRLEFLRAEADAKSANDKPRLQALRRAERDRQAKLRARDMFTEGKYDMQFAKEVRDRKS